MAELQSRTQRDCGTIFRYEGTGLGANSSIVPFPQMPSVALRDRVSSSVSPRASPVPVRPYPSPIRRNTLPVLRNGKAAREFTVSHEQTETNPAQPRKRLENAGERHLRRSTDCLGKPVRGGLAADERRNAHSRKSRRVIRAASR